MHGVPSPSQQPNFHLAPIDATPFIRRNGLIRGHPGLSPYCVYSKVWCTLPRFITKSLWSLQLFDQFTKNNYQLWEVSPPASLQWSWCQAECVWFTESQVPANHLTELWPEPGVMTAGIFD